MRILLPYDGSEYSKTALAFVCARPAPLQRTTKVTLIHVPLPRLPRVLVSAAGDNLRQYLDDVSRRILAPAVRALHAAQLTVKAVHPLGDPAQRIVRQAAADNCDLIVMGAHGRSARQGLLLGSVSRAVLADSAIPVLLLRRARPLPAGSLKVALAYDDSADSRAALDYVIGQRALFGPEPTLHLVHVVDEVPVQVRTALPNLTSTEFTHEKVRTLRAEAFEAVVARARGKLTKAGVAATEHLLVGSNAGDALAQFVRAKSIDLVVIGCRGQTRLQTALLGSVTARLAARSEVPLLLLRRA
ncbi:MAG: hypothetical protein AMXMBFR66_02970 [Pseudomonadota bacterium]